VTDVPAGYPADYLTCRALGHHWCLWRYRNGYTDRTGRRHPSWVLVIEWCPRCTKERRRVFDSAGRPAMSTRYRDPYDWRIEGGGPGLRVHAAQDDDTDPPEDRPEDEGS
jgi:hypothetical protein